MDQDEQDNLVQARALPIKPAIPNKPVRRIHYANPMWLNAISLLLAVLLATLSGILILDLSGKVQLKSYIVAPNTKHVSVDAAKTEQPQPTIEVNNYSNNNNQNWDDHDELTETKNYYEEQAEEAEQPQETTIPVPVPETNTQESEQINWEQSEPEEGHDQQFINEDDDKTNEAIFSEQFIDEGEAVDVASNENMVFIEENAVIEKPLIDNHNYELLELPNQLKIVLITTNDPKVNRIGLGVLGGYWDNQYYIRNKYQMEFSPTTTLYSINTNQKNLLTELDSLSKIFAPNNKLKRIPKQLSNFDELLALLADPGHPLSRDKLINSKLENSANQMTLIVETQMDMDKVKDFIVQSDFVLIPNLDKKQQIYGYPFKEMGKVVKYQDSNEPDSIKLIYQLKKAEEGQIGNLQFIDFILSRTVRNYVIDKQFGVNLLSSIKYDIFPSQIYEVTIELPWEDQFDFDSRELAFRFAKIMSTFAIQLDEQLFTNGQPNEYCEKLVKEFKQRNYIEYNYNTHEISLLELSENVNMGKIVEGLSLHQILDINYDNMRNIIQDLGNADNLLLFINDKQYQKHGNSFLEAVKGSATQDLSFVKDDELTEQLNDLSYSLKSLSDQTKSFIKVSDSTIEFEFPQLNQYTPYNLQLIDEKQSDKVIWLNNKQVGWQFDKSLNIPAIYAGFSLHLPNQRYFSKYIQDTITNEMKDAIDVGYSIETTSNDYLNIELYGWTDKFDKFYESIIETIQQSIPTGQLAEYTAQFDKSPIMFKYIDVELEQLMITNYQIMKQGLANCEWKAILLGNIDKKQSIQLSKMMNEAIEGKGKQQYQIQTKVLKLSGHQLIYPMQSDSTFQVIVNYYQFGQRNLQTFALASLVFKHLQNEIEDKQPKFTMASKRIGCVDGFVITKQSSDDLNIEDQNIDKFIQDNLKQFKKMNDKKLTELKNSVYNDQFDNLIDKGQWMFKLIHTDFDSTQLHKQILSIKKQELVEFIQSIGKISARFEKTDSNQKLNNIIHSKTDIIKMGLEEIQCK